MIFPMNNEEEEPKKQGRAQKRRSGDANVWIWVGYHSRDSTYSFTVQRGIRTKYASAPNHKKKGLEFESIRLAVRKGTGSHPMAVKSSKGADGSIKPFKTESQVREINDPEQ